VKPGSFTRHHARLRQRGDVALQVLKSFKAVEKHLNEQDHRRERGGNAYQKHR
jgi:hypothetical protein